MKKNRLNDWLQQISMTQDEEISCSQCFDLVSGYVEMEINHLDPADTYPLVQQHLLQCAACREEYHTLLDLRHLEEDHATPAVDDLRNLIQ